MPLITRTEPCLTAAKRNRLYKSVLVVCCGLESFLASLLAMYPDFTEDRYGGIDRRTTKIFMAVFATAAAVVCVLLWLYRDATVVHERWVSEEPYKLAPDDDSVNASGDEHA